MKQSQFRGVWAVRLRDCKADAAMWIRSLLLRYNLSGSRVEKPDNGGTST